MLGCFTRINANKSIHMVFGIFELSTISKCLIGIQTTKVHTQFYDMGVSRVHLGQQYICHTAWQAQYGVHEPEMACVQLVCGNT